MSDLDFTQQPSQEQILVAFKAWALADADPHSDWNIERRTARSLIEQLEALRNVAAAASVFESSFQRSLGSASAYDIELRNEAQAKLRMALNALNGSNPAKCDHPHCRGHNPDGSLVSSPASEPQS